MDTIVSDTTALIVLGAQQRLDLLGACFERVLVPETVYEEWLSGNAEVAAWVQERVFLQVVAVGHSSLLSELKGLLDAGEAEAIVLAKQRRLPLLIDEKKGRTTARMMGIAIFGLVGLLLLAVRRGVAEGQEVQSVLDQARKCGFRLSDRLYQGFLAELHSG